MHIQDSNEISHLVGQPLTDEILVELKQRHSTIRVKKPGFMYTQEFRIGRLNVEVDRNNVITGFHRG